MQIFPDSLITILFNSLNKCVTHVKFLTTQTLGTKVKEKEKRLSFHLQIVSKGKKNFLNHFMYAW
jgi:hypothetical protein